MKRLLAFLALFLGGMGVLRLAQGPGAAGALSGGEAPEQPWSRGDETHATGMTPRGAIEWNVRLPATEPGAPERLLRLRAEDSGPEEDGSMTRLTGVTMEFLAPGSEAVRTEVIAGRAMMKREQSNSDFTPKFAEKMTLWDVVLTAHEGAPIVPITLRTPRLELDLKTRTLVTDQPVSIEGEHLSGSGVGLVIEEPRRRLRLLRASHLNFPSEVAEGSLHAAGAIEVTRIAEQSGGSLSIHAFEDALLRTGSPGQVLEAQEIEIQGAEDSAGGFVPTRLDAAGEVAFKQANQEFHGERAQITFDELGQPERAQLDGPARAALPITRADLPVDAPLAEGDEVLVTSEGAMDVVWEATGLRFRAAGPAVVEGAGARLRSSAGVEVVSESGGEVVTLSFSERVHLKRDENVLVAGELTAKVIRDEQGRAVLDAVARDRPLITGVDREGRGFVLNATDSLNFRQVGEGDWSIPRADGAELTVLGPEGFRARADRVLDFDPGSLALVAEGNVEIESERGTGRGDRLTISGTDRFRLEGEPDRRASFEGPEGSGEALLIRRDGDELTFTGQVTSHLKPGSPGAQAYTLSCSQLSLKRSPQSSGSEDGAFDVAASGEVHALVEGAVEQLDLTCERLQGHHEEVLGPDGEVVKRISSLTASAVRRAEIGRPGDGGLLIQLACQTMDATRVATVAADGTQAVVGEAVARGEVAFQGSYQGSPFEGDADELRVDQAGKARVVAEEGALVSLEGLLPSSARPFEMQASWFELSPDRLVAHMPQIQVSNMQTGVEGAGDLGIRARAREMISTTSWLEFRGEVDVEGVTERKIPWTLNAGLVRFEGSAGTSPTGNAVGKVAGLTASQGVTLALPGRDMRALGESLQAGRLSGLMRIEGSPAKIESPDIIHEADWIELDVNLGFVVGSGKGRVRPPHGACSGSMHAIGQDGSQEAAPEWSIDYLSSRTLVEPDALIHVLQEPRISYRGEDLSAFMPMQPSGTVTVSASWAVLWVDRHRWGRLTDPDAENEPAQTEEPEEPAAGPSRFFRKMRGLGVLSEVYLEGPVEVHLGESPSAFASAVYLDIISGHGWIADANFTIRGSLLGRDFRAIKVHTRWLRQSDDTSFQADEATIALCEFEEPHLQITTGDLRIEQHPEDGGRFDVSLKDNRIELFDLIKIPLPSIDTSTDENFRPDIASLKIGDSARFGSFISAGIVRPGQGTARFVHRLLGRDDDVSEDSAAASYSLSGSWFGSRGPLLDLGMRVGYRDQYRFSTYLGAISDSSEDKGYIRVPEDDRSTLRTWLRSSGRYWFDERDWIDFSASHQSDAGVQSEFFESDFERYERSETYLRWRKARGANYYSATVKGQANDFFSDVSELPSVRAWRSRTQLLPLGASSLVYSADASAAYLKRFESVGGYASPFGLPATFADGLGERDVVRLDTTHRLEVPLELGAFGLRATPFALARATVWDENTLETDEPSRFLGEAGLRLSTTLWKRTEEGAIHQLAPYIEARADVVDEREGGVPVSFDGVEAPLGGTFVEAGLRGRFRSADDLRQFDVDLRGTHASDLPADAVLGEGWSSFASYSRLSLEPFGVPVEFIHDGRYDFTEGDTLFSGLGMGVRPRSDLAFELAHYRGLDVNRQTLYEAASVSALWTWTEKWEFEGQQTLSLRSDDRLGSKVIVRRYGHDLVFEIESSYREGEGASIGVGLRPLVSWDRPRIGFLGL